MPLSKLDALPEPVMRPPEQPGAVVTTDAGPHLPKDLLGRRLLWAGFVSVLVNVALWRIASQVVHNHILALPVPITFRRVIMPPTPKPHKQVVHKIVKLKPKPKPTVKPQPVIHHRVVRQVVKPTPNTHPRPVIQPKPAPLAAHHRILTARGITPTRPTALPDGHAKLGQPIANQKTGEGHDNNRQPTPQPKPETRPEPQPQPKPQPEPKPKPIPQPQPEPKLEPAGLTQDAQPSNQVNSDIPDELKTGEYKSHVRVKVDIQADGSFEASLLTSSGSTEIDRRVLEALKRWRWKPALENGKPVRSTQRFRFNFEVN